MERADAVFLASTAIVAGLLVAFLASSWHLVLEHCRLLGVVGGLLGALGANLLVYSSVRGLEWAKYLGYGLLCVGALLIALAAILPLIL